MIRVFTDAAVAKDTAVVSAIVLTDTDYLGFETRCYKDVSNSCLGELYGVLTGLQLLPRDCKEKIIIYTDSNQTVHLLSDNTKCLEPSQSVVDEIHELMYGLDIDIVHFKGHQQSHNPNKVVDLTSKKVLRNLIKEERCVSV